MPPHFSCCRGRLQLLSGTNVDLCGRMPDNYGSVIPSEIVSYFFQTVITFKTVSVINGLLPFSPCNHIFPAISFFKIFWGGSPDSPPSRLRLRRPQRSLVGKACPCPKIDFTPYAYGQVTTYLASTGVTSPWCDSLSMFVLDAAI